MTHPGVIDQIDTVFAQLNEQLLDADPRSKRDAAHAAWQSLESLRVRAVGSETAAVDIACQRAWCVYEALHQDLQDRLEWASSASID